MRTPPEPPTALLLYMEGLRKHDLDLIGRALSPSVSFVTLAQRINKAETLAFLAALYAGFPDWHYDHDPPQPLADGGWAVRWRQGGTHTGVLDFPGLAPIAPSYRRVTIPAQIFRYWLAADGIGEIRPDAVPGGAPRGIFEQLGVIPPL